MTSILTPIEQNGLRKIDLSTLETVLQRNTFWLLTEMEDQCNGSSIIMMTL